MGLATRKHFHFHVWIECFDLISYFLRIFALARGEDPRLRITALNTAITQFRAVLNTAIDTAVDKLAMLDFDSIKPEVIGRGQADRLDVWVRDQLGHVAAGRTEDRQASGRTL